MGYKNYTIYFESIELSSVQKYDDTRYNSNNHWTDDVKSNDYFTNLIQLIGLIK